MEKDVRMSAREVLKSCAPAAGLSAQLTPFPKAASLSEQFALNPFLMAPMAGVSDAAWRMMARAGGAALAYTEMISVAGIHYDGAKTWKLAQIYDPEPDLAIQVFGSKPEQFREAACALMVRLGPSVALIDINMACPVPKVIRKGEGAALMEDPARAQEIVCACKEGALEGARHAGVPPVPVTCKIRRGLKRGKECAPAFAKLMESAGVHSVVVHGRYADQHYRGEADWDVITRVVREVHIPVIASGDILSPERAARVLSVTGAAAVMVARGSYGNPWIFSDARAVLAGKQKREHPLSERLASFACHVRLLEATGAHMARARNLAGHYLKGLPHAAIWRNRAMQCVDAEDFLALLDELAKKCCVAGADI